MQTIRHAGAVVRLEYRIGERDREERTEILHNPRRALDQVFIADHRALAAIDVLEEVHEISIAPGPDVFRRFAWRFLCQAEQAFEAVPHEGVDDGERMADEVNITGAAEQFLRPLQRIGTRRIGWRLIDEEPSVGKLLQAVVNRLDGQIGGDPLVLDGSGLFG